MKNFKKIAALLLALTMMLGLLAACGKDGEGDKDPQATPGFVYVPTYADLKSDEKIQYINTSCWHEGTIYFIASVYAGEQTYTPDAASGTDVVQPKSASVTSSATGSDLAAPMPAEPGDGSFTYDVYRTGLFSMKEDGSAVTELPGYSLPAADPTGNSGSNVNAMTVDAKGNLWVLEYTYANVYDGPADMDKTSEEAQQYYTYQENYALRKLDATGAELNTIDLTPMKDPNGYFYSNGLSADKDGNVYIMNGSNFTLYVLDGEGKELFHLNGQDNNFYNMVALGDGGVALMGWDQGTGKSIIRKVDLATKALSTQSYDAPTNAYNFYPGTGDYDFYYNTESSLFGYKLETGENEKIITWINSDVNSEGVGNILPLADGRILCVYGDNTGDTPVTQLLTLTKTAASETVQKTVLTYACMYLDWNVRREIIKFNKANPEYRIEVQDYSEYNTQDDYTAGLTKLTTEIISGKVPDIMDSSNLPIRQYGAKGLLEDLWPMIDADTALGGRDALVQPLFNAMTQDGKLYQTSTGFSVITAYGLSKVVGEEPGWTLQELNAALSSLNPNALVLSEGATKDSMLNYLCTMYLGDFVNWETGECSFDSQLFIDLLTLTEKFPATFNWDNYDYANDYVPAPQRMSEGDQLMDYYYLSDFNSYVYNMGSDLSQYTFVGFPTSDGSMGSAYQVNSGLAMSSKCAHKDVAWQFMRTFLTEEYQTNNGWGLPSNQKVMDKKLKDQMTPTYTTDENGNKVEEPKMTYWNNKNEEIKVYAMDQATADKIMYVINNTTRTSAYDENLYKIVSEECAAYFAGQTDAATVAKNVQSRVSLYVNEQK